MDSVEPRLPSRTADVLLRSDSIALADDDRFGDVHHNSCDLPLIFIQSP
jgi:hypothetical protein